jgi:hypothetical protein
LNLIMENAYRHTRRLGGWTRIIAGERAEIAYPNLRITPPKSS